MWSTLKKKKKFSLSSVWKCDHVYLSVLSPACCHCDCNMFGRLNWATHHVLLGTSVSICLEGPDFHGEQTSREPRWRCNSTAGLSATAPWLHPGRTSETHTQSNQVISLHPCHSNAFNWICLHLCGRVYREVLEDFLQHSGVGQQLAVERRVLQQHGEDLSELRQLLLVQIGNTQRLQDNPQQARNTAQCCHARTPNCFPANVKQGC